MTARAHDWFTAATLIAATFASVSCSPQGPTPSELLTIGGMTLGATNPIENVSVRDYGDPTRACRCNEYCKLYANADDPKAVVRLWPEQGDDGSCRLMEYAVTREEALAASAAGTNGAAFDLYNLSGQEVVARYATQQPYVNIVQPAYRLLAYCIPLTQDSFAVYHLPFTEDQLQFLYVQILKECPTDPFPPVP